MKLVIQRVTQAQVAIAGCPARKIGRGYLVLIGIAPSDTIKIADKFLAKLLKLRIFEDAQGKTNLSLADVNGSLLLVSQFTLLADCKSSNRPGFSGAAQPGYAQALYDHFVEQARLAVPIVETGEFGADMQVSLTNDGPFTILLDNDTVKIKESDF